MREIPVFHNVNLLFKLYNMNSNGFSLLEALIALIIITSALLGIITLQNSALRQVHAAYYQNMAMTQAQALMERLRADPSAAGLAQEAALAAPVIANLLPQGRGEYQCAGVPAACTISIFWQDHGPQTLTLSSLL